MYKVSDMYGNGPVEWIPRPKVPSPYEKTILLEYIRDNECGTFEELLGCVLADLRDGVPSATILYGLCFDCTSWCRNYCKLYVDGRLESFLELVKTGFVT